MRIRRSPVLTVLLAACAGTPGAAAQMSSADQIAGAVLAAPEGMRADATVLGYGGEALDGDPLTLLRAGSNDIVCLADDPDREGFHVACYHDSMGPFMAMGRRLAAEGTERGDVQDARGAAIEAGEIEAPAAALWSLSSRAEVDPSAGAPEDARRLSVVYVPYAEAETIGLPTRPDGNSPWLMLPGQPWAHIMISR